MILEITASLVIILFVLAVLAEIVELGFIGVVVALVGFGILGIGIPVEETRDKIPVTVYCSKESGECRVKELRDFKSFTLDKAIHVNYLLENEVDSLIVIKQFNSYGVTVKRGLDFND